MIMIRILIIVIAALMLTTVIASASNPPQAVITCYGSNEVSEGHLVVYVDSGSKVALIGSSSQDDVGIVSHIWTKNGTVESENVWYSPVVTENTEYVLTVTDGEGKSDSETIEVRLNYVAPPNNNLPNWKGEILSSNEDDLLVGDEITLDANIQSSYCVGYEIEWSVRDDNIIIINKSSERTKIRIGEGTAIGKHTIEVVLSNSEKSRDQEIRINVVKNTPPTLTIDYEYPFSYGTLRVDFSESKTGSNGNEYNDYIQRCYVRLDDGSGNFVNDGSWDVDHSRMPLSVAVKTMKMGNHSIYVTIEDSHGAVSTTREDIWVQEGNSTRDPLIVKAPDTVTCMAGKECKFSVYQTYQLYKDRGGVSFSYFDMTYESNPEKLASPDGYYLTGYNFRHIFPYSGNFTVKVVVTGSGDRYGFKNVNVTVIENETAESVSVSSNQTLILTSTQEQTPTPAQTKLVVAPQATPYLSETSTAETPGMKAWMAITMIIMAIVFIGKKKI